MENLDRSLEARRSRIRAGTGTTSDFIHVAWCLLYGDGVEEDVSEGMRLLTQAATGGSGEACVRLADIYAEGSLVERDCALATAWYLRGQNASGFHGVYGAAVAQWFGNECVEQDREEALRLFRIAADRGHLPSRSVVNKADRAGASGFASRVVALFSVPVLLVQNIFEVLRGDPSDRLWDSGRWLPNSPSWRRLRTGTRFE